jgi:hypothetical protein
MERGKFPVIGNLEDKRTVKDFHILEVWKSGFVAGWGSSLKKRKTGFLNFGFTPKPGMVLVI